MKRLLTLTLILVASMSMSKAQQYVEKDYVEVSGSAADTVYANRLEIEINLSEEPSKGVNTLQQQEVKLEQALKRSGVDIKSQVVVTGQSQQSAKRKNIYQYKNLRVTVNSVEAMNRLFDELDEAKIPGARLGRYYNNEVEAIRMELKGKAVLNAKTNAEALVAGLNQRIGGAIRINDYSSNSAVAYEHSVMMRSSANSDTMGGEEALQLDDVELKPIIVSQRVTVRFFLM